MTAWSLRLELRACAMFDNVVALRSRAPKYASSSGRIASKALRTLAFHRLQVGACALQTCINS